jgi:hypothetical protein
VRVSRPQDLAEFVLKNEGDWNTDSIKKAMNGRNRRVILKNTIPVFFLYSTAFPDENNRVSFYADIYGRDAELIEALKKHDDLSDKLLFAPKAVPPAELPSVEPLEAAHTEPVVATNNQIVPAVERITSEKTAPTNQPVAGKEEKTASNPDSAPSP